MLKGLRRKETYDELINELGIDPIKRYPDRRATQIENSNYLSQLASGFQEVLAQNDRIVKEKTKELLLQESTGASNISHREHSVYNSVHSNHDSVHSNHDDDDISSINDEPIPPPPPPPTPPPPPPPPHQEIRTEVRQGPRGVVTSVSPVIHFPAASLNNDLINSMLNPDITMSASSSSTKRKPQVFNIADDIDEDIEEHHQQHAEDFRMQQEKEEEKQHHIILQAQAMMDETNEQLMPFVRTKRESSPPATAPRAKAKPTPKKPARPNPDAKVLLTQTQIRQWLASHQKRLRVGDDLPPITEVACRAGVHRDTVYACMAAGRINLRSQYALSRAITELEEEMQGKVRTRLMSISLAGGQAQLRFGVGTRIFGQ